MKDESLPSSAPVEKEEQIFIDGDFNDSYEARVKRATGKNMIVSKEEYKSLQEESARLRSLIQEAFEYGWFRSKDNLYSVIWEQFKKDNNL